MGAPALRGWTSLRDFLSAAISNLRRDQGLDGSIKISHVSGIDLARISNRVWPTGSADGRSLGDDRLGVDLGRRMVKPANPAERSRPASFWIARHFNCRSDVFCISRNYSHRAANALLPRAS